jgi:hypothetical protein
VSVGRKDAEKPWAFPTRRNWNRGSTRTFVLRSVSSLRPREPGLTAGLHLGLGTGYPRKTSVMRIAQIAPLYESVAPKLYGGTERVVACLSDALVQRGHEVVLLASGDSKTRGGTGSLPRDSFEARPKALLGRSGSSRHLAEFRKRANDFGILHFHLDCFHLPSFQDMPDRTLTTVHGRQDDPADE